MKEHSVYEACHNRTEHEYQLLTELLGINSPIWEREHIKFNQQRFKYLKKNIIAEYIILDTFVANAEAYGVIYNPAIDEFLREYKDAVKGCLNLQN